jgi:hypothetical protein
MSDSIRSKVSEFLASNGVSFAAVLAGATVREYIGCAKWECDEWRVTLKRADSQALDMVLPYFTGTGHRKQVKPMPSPAYRKGTLAYEQWARDAFKPQAPHAADVLHSLMSDSSAADQSFNDWCADMGMDSDSIKAFTTYQACCVIGDNMRKLFSRTELDALREMLQDY